MRIPARRTMPASCLVSSAWASAESALRQGAQSMPIDASSAVFAWWRWLLGRVRSRPQTADGRAGFLRARSGHAAQLHADHQRPAGHDFECFLGRRDHGVVDLAGLRYSPLRIKGRADDVGVILLTNVPHAVGQISAADADHVDSVGRDDVVEVPDPLGFLDERDHHRVLVQLFLGFSGAELGQAVLEVAPRSGAAMPDGRTSPRRLSAWPLPQC